MSDHASDLLFREGRYDEAADSLRAGLERQGESGSDYLLYLLDVGLSLHSAGKYAESNKYFLQADKIADIKDYTSLAAEGGSLLTSENIKDYKGEDFEKVLINTYLAMNYAGLGDYENSLVEARRVNRKLHLMVTEGERKYKQNAFARYLSAVVYEAEGNYNDAYVDYKQVATLASEYPGLGRDLWRMAWLLRMPDQMERWNKEYGLTDADHTAAKLAGPKSAQGEVVVFYENGISPVKRPNPQFERVPKFYPRPNPVEHAQVEVDGQVLAQTAVLHDIELTAIENLDEKYAGMVAKRIAGMVVKEVASHEIEKQTKSPLIGFLARVAFAVADQADVRSWNLLPRDLQVARVTIPPGDHRIRLIPMGAGSLAERTVKVVAGRKAFMSFRYMP